MVTGSWTPDFGVSSLAGLASLEFPWWGRGDGGGGGGRLFFELSLVGSPGVISAFCLSEVPGGAKPPEELIRGTGTLIWAFFLLSSSSFVGALGSSLLRGTLGASANSSSLSSSERNGFSDLRFSSVSSCDDVLFSTSASFGRASAFILKELDLAELSGGGFEGLSGRKGFSEALWEPDSG